MIRLDKVSTTGGNSKPGGCLNLSACRRQPPMVLPSEQSIILFSPYMKSQLELCRGLNWSDCDVSKILIIYRMWPVNKQGSSNLPSGLWTEETEELLPNNNFGFRSLPPSRSYLCIIFWAVGHFAMIVFHKKKDATNRQKNKTFGRNVKNYTTENGITIYFSDFGESIILGSVLQ